MKQCSFMGNSEACTQCKLRFLTSSITLPAKKKHYREKPSFLDSNGCPPNSEKFVGPNVQVEYKLVPRNEASTVGNGPPNSSPLRAASEAKHCDHFARDSEASRWELMVPV